MRAIHVIAIALAVGILTVPSMGESAAPKRCRVGSALAFVTIRPNPPHLVGTIPSTFDGRAEWFIRRYNCKRRSAQVRRVDLGVYDVRFPGLNPVTIVATAVSDEGVSASAVGMVDGVVRVALRGPLTTGGDVATRRDVPFSVVVF